MIKENNDETEILVKKKVKKIKPVAEKIQEETEKSSGNDYATKEISVKEVEELQKKAMSKGKVAFGDIEGKMVVIKVGTEENPASDNDIKNIEEKINELLNRFDVKCLAFVTHHAVDVQIIR